MKVLLIGGTGCISFELTLLLANQQGIELYVLNRGNNNTNIPENANVLVGDFCDRLAMEKMFDGMTFDVVADFISYSLNDVQRAFDIFKGKVKQYIFISTVMTYHKPSIQPVINEGLSQKNPYSKYAQDKIKCEQFLFDRYREDNFPITIVRPSHTYDKRYPIADNFTVIERMLSKKPIIIQGDGTTYWTITHSRDFAKAFFGIMGNVKAIGQAMHITSDEVLTWNQIYETMADVMGVELNCVHVSTDFLVKSGMPEKLKHLYHGDKSNNVLLDNSKIKALVPSFCAKISFAQGFKEVYNYYLQNKDYIKIDEYYDNWCDTVVKVLDKAASEVERSVQSNNFVNE